MTASNAHCRVETDGRGVAQLTICNAGAMIIFNSQVIAALTTAINELGSRKDLRALVLRGDSEKAFVGGADIKEMATLDQAGGERFITALRDLCEAVRTFPQPVIARIPGW